MFGGLENDAYLCSENDEMLCFALVLINIINSKNKQILRYEEDYDSSHRYGCDVWFEFM